MKIVFVCGSVERGCDGVGDYTRRLAQALHYDKHEVFIIAFRDSYVKEQQREIIKSEIGEIKVLRLPHIISLKESSLIIKNEINEIKPDWVSLQFVIFAFHDKGLPFGLGPIFGNSFQGYKVHIMFHELWLGIGKFNNIKHAVWGFFQKRIILSLLNNLKPRIIHANSSWYAMKLRKIAKNVKVLPLFSNIPLFSEHVNKNKEIDFQKIKSFNFVVFGHISLHAPVEDFVNELAHFSENNQLDISITFLGNNNSDLQLWTEAWSSKFKVNVMGHQTESNISKYLSNADIGITTTPYALLDKSGSFYALLDHSLPVINISDLNDLKQERIDFLAPKGLFQYTIGNLEEIMMDLELPETLNQLNKTKDRFLDDLRSI
jgi:hypothetical protein